MDTKNKELDIEKLEGISALFIHVAKIDDNYTDKEKNIILGFLRSFGAERLEGHDSFWGYVPKKVGHIQFFFN